MNRQEREELNAALGALGAAIVDALRQDWRFLLGAYFGSVGTILLLWVAGAFG